MKITDKYIDVLTDGEWWDYIPDDSSDMELGLFEVKESTVGNPDGSVRVTRTTKVTGKGQQYFINKFLSRKCNNEYRD